MAGRSSILTTYFCKTISLRNYITSLGLSLTTMEKYSNMLNRVVISIRHGGSLYPQKYSVERTFTLEDIIHHAIEHLISTKSSNIITLGYDFIREWNKNGCIAGSCHVQMSFVNTIVSYLKTRPWEALHNLIGDDMLFHLFINAYMFLTVANGSYIQLTGRQVSDLDENKSCTENCSNKCNRESNYTKIKSKCIEKPSGTKVCNNNVVEGVLEGVLQANSTGKRKCSANDSTCKKRKLNAQNQFEYRNSLVEVKLTNSSSHKKRKFSSKDSSCKRQKLDTHRFDHGTNSVEVKRNVAQMKEKHSNVGNVNSLELKVRKKQSVFKKIEKATSTVRYGERKSSSAPSYLQRSKLFYSKIPIERIARKYILSNVNSSNAGIIKVMNTIFQFSEKDKIKRIPKHLLGFKGFIKAIIMKFKSCKFQKFLNYYCHIEKWLKIDRTTKKKKRKKFKTTVNVQSDLTFNERIRYKFAARSYVPPHKVLNFIFFIYFFNCSWKFLCKDVTLLLIMNILNFVCHFKPHHYYFLGFKMVGLC